MIILKIKLFSKLLSFFIFTRIFLFTKKHIKVAHTDFYEINRKNSSKKKCLIYIYTILL